MPGVRPQRRLAAWRWPHHRLRSVLVRPRRDRLAGIVQVDETYIGGEEPGLRGGRAKGKKALVGVAVEVKEPRGYGRARMAILRDGSAALLHPFITGHVEHGTRVITVSAITELSSEGRAAIT